MDIEGQMNRLIEVKRNSADANDPNVSEYVNEQISILAAQYSKEKSLKINGKTRIYKK